MWAAELFPDLTEPAITAQAPARPPLFAAQTRVSRRSRLVAGLLGLLLPLVGLTASTGCTPGTSDSESCC